MIPESRIDELLALADEASKPHDKHSAGGYLLCRTCEAKQKLEGAAPELAAALRQVREERDRMREALKTSVELARRQGKSHLAKALATLSGGEK